MKKNLPKISVILLIFVGLISLSVYFLINLNLNNSCKVLNYLDSGMAISFEYDSCKFNVSTNLSLTSDFYLDEEKELFGPVAKSYDINLKTSNNSILKISKVLIPQEPLIISLDLKQYKYEKINEKIARYSTLSSNEFIYGQFFECETLPQFSDVNRRKSNVCISSNLNGFGSQFTNLVNVIILNPNDLALFDNFIIENF